jgi:ABC-2 type transport system ATP-binding protein
LIAVEGLTKRFGSTVAVDGLSFAAPAGAITGFLGPNGAGKTTTLRCLLGLVRPTAGVATIDGRVYRELAEPMQRVGAVLEQTSFHPGRRARDHLRVLAAAAGLPASRVDEVLRLVGLADHKRRRVRGYSLGMRQRLALAAALLGDPDVLVLDEPANGLDPEGIRWLREFLRSLASQGRTILVSSHVLAEVAQTADRAVIINRGRLIRDATLAELANEAGTETTVVRTPDPSRLREVLAAAGIAASHRDDGRLAVDAPAESVGRVAAEHGVVLLELGTERANLEDVFFALTRDDTAS